LLKNGAIVDNLWIT